MVMSNAKSSCGACGGTLEVLRVVRRPNQPPRSFKAPCPLCVPLGQTWSQSRRIPRPLPFPMRPAPGKN